MTHFRLSHRAESDLEAIADYIAVRNPSAAVQELEKLLDTFTLLGSSPLLGQLRPDLPGSPRTFAARSFVIVYKPASDGIEVARVVHAARDLASLLHREKK
jgi:toxin ParE1/3/4